MRVQWRWTLHRPGVKSRQRALLPHHGDSSPFRLQQLWSSRFFHFLLGSYSAAWSFLYPVFAAPGGNRLGRFRSIFWRRGGVGGQDGADGEHSKDMKEAGVEAEQSNRGGGGASPLQEERLQQACVICGMLGCCIPGTFFPRHFFLQRCKVTGELTAEEM